MGTTSFVTSKIAQSLISTMTPSITNRALQRMWPFDPEDFVLRLGFVPGITINHDQHSSEFLMHFAVKNHSIYQIEVFDYECEVFLSGNPFLTFKTSEVLMLKSGGKDKKTLRVPLSQGDVKKAVEKNRQCETHPASYALTFSARTRFGYQKIHCEKLESAIIIRVFGQPH